MASRRSFLSSLALLAGAGGAAWLLRERLMRRDIAVEGPESSGPIQFASRRSPLAVIPVGLNGRVVPALVDSGAEYTVIDDAFARELALPSVWTPPLVAYGVGGGAQVGRGVGFDLKLGSLTLAGYRAVALTLGPISSIAGLSTPLVLGQDVLGALVADIDFPARSMAFHRPGTLAVPAGAIEAVARKNRRALEVSISVEDRPVPVILDTGASAALSLSRATAQTAGLLDGRRLRETSTIVLGGVARRGSVEAETVRFAGEVLREVEVHIFDASGAPIFPVGLLGVEALRRWRAILDLGAGRLHLVRSQARPDVGRRRRRSS
ncbi:MAG TPA: aspartyl protease family protein [Caulobacteraceae bacterium]